MGTEIAINVNVTISDELRSLLAAGRGIVAEPDAIAPPLPLVPAEPVPAPVNWQDIILRRDGQRPLAFRGLPIVTRHCASDDLPGRAEQTLSLYVAEDRTVYAALAFQPPHTAPARPLHRCQIIRDQDEFEAFLNSWHPELCFEAARVPTLHQHPAAGPLAVRSAFNSMAADCLCKGMLQA